MAPARRPALRESWPREGDTVWTVWGSSWTGSEPEFADSPRAHGEPVAQDQRQVAGLRLAEVTGDLRLATELGLLDGGSGLHDAVEDDGQAAARALLARRVALRGGLVEGVGAPVGEGEVDGPGAPEVLHPGPGVVDRRAPHRGRAQPVARLRALLLLPQEDHLLLRLVVLPGRRLAGARGGGRRRGGRRRGGLARGGRGGRLAGRGAGRRAGRRGRRRGRLGLLAGRGELGQNGPEAQLRRLAHHVEGTALVPHPGQLDDDGVALAGDLGLGHAEGVDPVADDLDGLVEHAAGVHPLRRLEDDRGAALEVEAELGLVPRRQGGGQRPEGQDDDEDQRRAEAAHLSPPRPPAAAPGGRGGG